MFEFWIECPHKPFVELSQLNAVNDYLLAELQNLTTKVEVSISMTDNLLQHSFIKSYKV